MYKVRLRYTETQAKSLKALIYLYAYTRHSSSVQLKYLFVNKLKGEIFIEKKILLLNAG